MLSYCFWTILYVQYANSRSIFHLKFFQLFQNHSVPKKTHAVMFSVDSFGKCTLLRDSLEQSGTSEVCLGDLDSPVPSSRCIPKLVLCFDDCSHVDIPSMIDRIERLPDRRK